MDDRRFDALVKSVVEGGASRRRLVKGLIGAGATANAPPIRLLVRRARLLRP